MGTAECSAMPTATAHRPDSRPSAEHHPPEAERSRSPRAKNHGPFGGPVTCFLVHVLPGLCLGLLIFFYGVDTPWGDQWDGTALLFEKMQMGNLHFSDFFAFHSEHRILFPRLIAFALGQLTHWNVRAEMGVMWVLACLCSLAIWRLARTTNKESSVQRDWLLLASNVLLFSPLQWENFLWGFQIDFLLPIAATITALWVAVAAPRPYDFLGTLALCVIATFSIASGFTAWLLVAPLLYFRRAYSPPKRHWIWWAVWLTAAALCIGFYFHGFVRPAYHPKESYAFAHPFIALRFFLAYLGNPFAHGTVIEATDLAQIVGLALLLTLGGCLFYLWKWRRDQLLLSASLPWLSLTGITLFNGVLATIGRSGFGLVGAIQSRYVSFAVALPIGLLFLVTLVMRDWRKRDVSEPNAIRRQTVLVSYLTALCVLSLFADTGSLKAWKGFQHDRLTGKAILTLSQVLDDKDALKRYIQLSAGPDLLRRIKVLDQLGYLRPALLRTPDLQGIAFKVEGESIGALNEFSGPINGVFTAKGWAINAAKHRVADSVLLAYQNAQGHWIMFARAEVRLPRPAVSERLDDDTYFYSGWIASWRVEQVPASARRISVWAFDSEDCRAYQLDGMIGGAPPEPSRKISEAAKPASAPPRLAHF